LFIAAINRCAYLYRIYLVNLLATLGLRSRRCLEESGYDTNRGTSKPPTATMSDAGQLSDEEVNGQATPAGNADEGTPLNTVEDNGLEDDEDDLFGDGDGDAGEDAPA